ncbi:MAG: hypothetical protein FWF12_02110 [Betaproteobacteria bacterium]|nr:hypothetical protein [Betaproteobacteria bacterium]
MDYHSPAQCLGLLKNLPTDNPLERLSVLADIVAALLAARPTPEQYLEVLETARPLVDKTRARLSGLDGNEPLPPDSQHNELLLKVIKLWIDLSRSYALVTTLDAETLVLKDQRALLAQRRTYYAGKIVSEYYRAHRVLPAGLWRQAHECFMAAERDGIPSVRISDTLNAVWKAQSAQEAYITILLLDLANAFGRSGQEWTWICRWAERFAPYCTLSTNIEGCTPMTYGLDLTADHGLRPLGLLHKDSNPRYFDCNKLASQIQSVFAQFKQGVSPSSLGLGEDCSVDTCARLLLSLYRPWGLASAGRRFPRRGSTGVVELCAEWLAIGFHIQGKLFEQPWNHNQRTTTSSLGYTHDELALHTFGERAAGVETELTRNGKRNFNYQHLEAERLGLVCERWELVDQSVGGFRLQQRPHSERLSHHQLVGLHPQDGEYFLLGQVSWLMFRDDGLLETGIHVLSGLPRVIAARQCTESDDLREPYSQAFIIEANNVLQVTASLILPEGWYKTNGVIEVFDAGIQRRLRMIQLLLKGPNFEQVGFTELSEPG